VVFFTPSEAAVRYPDLRLLLIVFSKETERMPDFKVYTSQDAPENSRQILADTQKKYGFVPNLFGVLAESPAALEGYASIGNAFSKSSLSAVEQQVVLLSTSFENGCTYCMAAHSAVAKMIGATEVVVQSLRDGTAIPDNRLEALRTFTRTLVEKRGWVSQQDIDSFLSAGYNKAQILEVITGIVQKTLSNYTDHIAHTPLDEAFEPLVWTAPAEKAAV
jgi:uncharacterized peroxidase-related enzyme